MMVFVYIELLCVWQYFETDDPDLYVSKIEYMRDNDAEDLELVFAEEEYDEGGQVVKVAMTCRWYDVEDSGG